MSSKLTRKLRALFGKEKMESELDEELRFHLEREIEQNIRQGMSAEEARSAALRSFGGVEQIKEECRDVRGTRVIEELWQDVRYGVRRLHKNLGFTFVAVLMLALGIGANTAIFSVINAVLLRPLPFTEPDRLMMVWLKGAEAAGGDRTPLSVADLLDWRAQNQVFESVDAFWTSFYNYTGGETPERIHGAGVTANFFVTLAVQPALGRTFLPEEEQPGANRVVVVSQTFWRKRLASDRQVTGRTINLNGTSYTIVGVMPHGFDFPQREVELWAALQLEPPSRRGPYFLTGLGRVMGSNWNIMRSSAL